MSMSIPNLTRHGRQSDRPITSRLKVQSSPKESEYSAILHLSMETENSDTPLTPGARDFQYGSDNAARCDNRVANLGGQINCLDYNRMFTSERFPCLSCPLPVKYSWRQLALLAATKGTSGKRGTGLACFCQYFYFEVSHIQLREFIRRL